MIMDTIIISKANVSKDYNGGDAVRFGATDAGSKFARFRVGSKKYDKNAPNNARWQNYSVVAYDRVAAKLEKVSPREGTALSLTGEFSMESWTDKQGVIHETPTITLQNFELINSGSKQSGDKTNGNSSNSSKSGTPASQRDNFTGYENFSGESAGFFDEDYEEI